MQPSEAIERLISSGMSETSIGSAVGVNQSTVNRIRRGQIPRFDVGKAIVDLAESVGSDPSKHKAA